MFHDAGNGFGRDRGQSLSCVIRGVDVGQYRIRQVKLVKASGVGTRGETENEQATGHF
jgi:hypothetical protein